MTSSSSPGISLKQEGISYLAGSQLPAVIINVVRGGPGLGNIASSQSDYFQATRGGGHGDYYTPVLAPAGVQEAAELTSYAFDLADFYRTPVLILADAIIGQMMEPVNFGARSTAHRVRKDWALGRKKAKSHHIVRSLFIKEGALEAHNQKLLAKWNKIKSQKQRHSTYKTQDADYLIIAYGSQARIAQAAVDNLRKQKIKAGLFRPISLWPYPVRALEKIAKGVKKILVVEQSLGQMVEDVRLTLGDAKIHFMGRAGGGIPQEIEIVDWIKKNLWK